MSVVDVEIKLKLKQVKFNDDQQLRILIDDEVVFILDPCYTDDHEAKGIVKDLILERFNIE